MSCLNVTLHCPFVTQLSFFDGPYVTNGTFVTFGYAQMLPINGLVLMSQFHIFDFVDAL